MVIVKEKRASILIIDDEPEMFDLISHILEEENYNLTFAQKTPDALAAMEEKKFDLIIADVFLQKTTSEELLQIIKERSPDMKVLMITGMGDNQLWIDLINKGAVDLIPKPINEKTFKRAIHDTLKGIYPTPRFRAA